MNKKFEIKGLFTGKAEILSNGQKSAIRKQSTDTITVTKEVVSNDEVVDQKYHGGNMRVVHHYSGENYSHLKKCFPDIADRFIPGTYGENLYTDELTEEDLCIGDIFIAGTTKLQVTVPRKPCATINASYEDKRILKEIINSKKFGWFYTVLEEGEIKIGDTLELIERPNPKLILTKLIDQGYGKEKYKDLELLKACYETGLMDKGWKPKLEKLFS